MGGPESEAFIARMAALSDRERLQFVDLVEMTGFGMQRGIEENEKIVEQLEGVERVFDAAHDKLRAEGKPIDPDMTLEEAYRILEE